MISNRTKRRRKAMRRPFFIRRKGPACARVPGLCGALSGTRTRKDNLPEDQQSLTAKKSCDYSIPYGASTPIILLRLAAAFGRRPKKLLITSMFRFTSETG
jgi:hypothetical protein